MAQMTTHRARARGRYGLGVLLAVLVVAGCSGKSTPATAPQQPSTTSTSATPTPADPRVAVKAAVIAYSRAYLGGDGPRAFAYLSQRCQLTLGRQQMDDLARQAKATYGAMTPTHVTVTMTDATHARVTYTFAAATLNQTDQPWVYEHGWRYDKC